MNNYYGIFKNDKNKTKHKIIEIIVHNFKTDVYFENSLVNSIDIDIYCNDELIKNYVSDERLKDIRVDAYKNTF